MPPPLPPPQPAPGPPVALRLKRPRAAPAPDILQVRGTGPPAKRPRTVSSCIATLSLASPVSQPPPPRRATFRRVEPTTPGVRRAIAKGSVVDVTARLLRREGVGKDVKRIAGMQCGGDTVMLCNGTPVVREKVCCIRGTISRSTDKDGASAGFAKPAEEAEEEDFVYDVYLRDTDCDLVPETEPTAGIGDEGVEEAVLMAEDVPDVLFWGDEDGAESADDEPGDAYLEDSEGSVDYPSTPDSNAYVDEVIDESSDSDESDDISKKAWEERRVRFGGARAVAFGTSSFGGYVRSDDPAADDGSYEGSNEKAGFHAFDEGDDGYVRGAEDGHNDDADDDEDDE